ncbi:hypothetical protein [Natronococcus jeotgali]|uniref:hypothetical protein n=1 Tax=Natronococcus jeotgali TaxID=413812 RepID=UPI00126890B5|nr:hypothetical protein [Natronococcus jeotgali]
MLVESFSFSSESGIFPQFAAAVTVFGCTVLLLRGFLPKPLQQAIVESDGIFNQYSGGSQEKFNKTNVDYDKNHKPETHNENVIENDDADVDSTKQLLLVGLLTGYGLIGYLIGLVWATPIFIGVFAKIFNFSWFDALMVVSIGIVAALAFNSILPVNMTNGVVF